ncbi:MAG TPA: hypothetical protein ENK47_04345 [Euryarchaeota archaeon]|nr:MAG: hypothetical protein B6U90_03185 [Thermoplasmatales archaeon ex4484_6]RLF65415.1 MAG: hypothetical protein DRN57_09150 [Thermoplasmata archaeon]HHD15916.1 hypothetical protein [Euryarchaeota archaeon]
MTGPESTTKAGKNDGFWDLIAAVSGSSMRRRPPFSRSWIMNCSREGRPADSRENLYVRTELHQEDTGTDRLYNVSPHEYELDDGALECITDIMRGLEKDPPPSSIMDDETSLRRYVERRTRRELSTRKKDLGGEEPTVLSRICGQYSVGFGVLEHLLRDERVQDIYIDPPFRDNPVRVVLGGMADPEMEGSYPTNIRLTNDEVERMVSILRFVSGKPFSVSDPVLECDMPHFNARITAVSPPMSQNGVSIAIRKHSHDPWTLLRSVRAGALSTESAAFLDICLDGRSSMLIAGPRGAGKSSLLGALLFNIDPARRIILIEDTPELPASALSSQGFSIVPLKVDDDARRDTNRALRTALRLGESVLVLGEVRGPETRTLYEAMSAGTAGSAVLGTFHADSAVSVYKRAVEDIGVSPGSFSATDLVVVCGLVQPKGRRVRYRRIVQISEYIKKGEGGRFRDLFRYDSRKERLVRTDGFETSDTVKRISSLWGMNPYELMDDLSFRKCVFDHALDMLSDEDLTRPSTMIRVMTELRNTREREVRSSGRIVPDRAIRRWKRAFDDEEEEWTL